MFAEIIALAAALSAADFGPPPSSETIQRVATQAVLDGLIDPYSAHLSWPYAPVAATRKAILGHTTMGWAVCGRLNAKNRMGGYTGEVWVLATFNDGQVTRLDVGDPTDGIDPATISCNGFAKQGALAPLAASVAPEASGAQAASEQAQHGGYGFSVLPTQNGGIVIAVSAGSRAEAAGLRPMQVITAINGEPTAGLTSGQLVTILLSGAAGYDLAISGAPDVHLPAR